MKSKTTAGLLALLLGGIGAHKFYLNKPMWGVAYLVFCWTFIPAIVALIEALNFFFMSEATFNERYGNSTMLVTPSGVVIATAATHVKCPECRELIIKDARKCRHCGSVLVAQ